MALVRDVSVASAREAQQEWARTVLSKRLALVRRIRHELAASGPDLCKLFSPELVRTPAESLTAEVIPLAEACRFLEREAARILRAHRENSRSRPFWLHGVDVEVHREPLGVVLVIGPRNYPLFLPCVQVLQALVAGNAVLLKPGSGGSGVAQAFRLMVLSAGVPADLFQVLEESPEAGVDVIRSGVDKVVLTGSLRSGERVYAEAARHLTPVIMELSGYDPVIVLASADLERAASAITFALKLNGGATCIAPRRIFVAEEVAEAFEQILAQKLNGESDALSIHPVRDNDEAVEAANDCAFALGATIFGQPERARSLAARINAGVVTINDMIVPTADPRVPFGGRKLSGFGTTRGAEGLLAMTVPKAIVTQRSRRLRHLEPQPANAVEIFAAYLSASHLHGWRQRWQGWSRLMKAISGAREKA